MARPVNVQKAKRESSSTLQSREAHQENARPAHGQDATNGFPTEDKAREQLNKNLDNPLGRFSLEELSHMGEEYCRGNLLGEEEDIRAFRLGAQIAKEPAKFTDIEGMLEDEIRVLQEEHDHRWKQPKLLYLVIVLCSVCAAVQGMGMSSPLHTACT
jgi:hypothetical protein